jgi:spore maturation protein CgeB
MRIVILGLSVTSSWGNGHATNYRALLRALVEGGDEVLFLERDVPWYAAHRDLAAPPWGRTVLYRSLEELAVHADALRRADLILVGSFVAEGVAVAEWALRESGGATAFYDIDTPVTLEKLRRGEQEYLTPELIPRFDLYLSFTGGPVLDTLREQAGARRPVFFPCFVDPSAYTPREIPDRWALSYLGTYAAGRQPAVEELLLAPARARAHESFVVAGPMYPAEITWPANVERIEHLPPGEHPAFYCASRFTLNLTRPEMRAVGHSPSVRLFEAAACGTVIVSDRWAGLSDVLEPGHEILVADGSADVIRLLEEVGPAQREGIAAAARARVLREHTAQRRVEQLHGLLATQAAAP